MNLTSVGRLIREARRSKGFTLRQLAAAAGVGRSTLAALEAGTIAELGFQKVSRICEALDLAVEVRPFALEAPLMAHRHITESAGRELTKAAIEDVIVRGDVAAWRGLVHALRKDKSGRLTRRVREVTAAASRSDPRMRAFSTLLPQILKHNPSRRKPNG